MSRNKITFYVLHMNYGGVESSVAQVANFLVDDFDVEIVSVYDFGKIPFKLDDRIEVIYLTNQKPNRQELKQAWQSKRGFVRELIKAGTLWLSRRRLVKEHIKNNSAQVLISTRVLFHDLIGKYSEKNQVKICQEHVDYKFNTKYLKKVLRSIKKADYLMPVSQFLAGDYQDMTKIKIKYIPHSVKVTDNYNYHPSKKIMAVGRLAPDKGFGDLIDVFKLISDTDDEFSLDIYGDGDEKANLELQISQLSLKNVKLHGFQPPEVLNEAYKQAGLFAMCSLDESFGLVFIESFAHGVPAIAFDSARGAREIINPGAGILIKNRDKAAMAKAILELTDEQKNNMSLVAHQIAKKYDINIIKQQWIDFISQVIKEKQ